jgi:NADPH-dependent F420 reductase
VVVLAVPYAAQVTTAVEVRAELEGKVLVDVTAPLVPPRVDRVQLPGGESASVALQRRLGDGVKVVSAFQNVSAVHLKDPEHRIDCDVLVCGDDPAAREVVIGLARDAGLRAWHAGVLANSVATEALTSVLIALNKRYKVPASGIRITGIHSRDEGWEVRGER